MNRREASRLTLCTVLLSLGGVACPRAATPARPDNPATDRPAADEAMPGDDASSPPAAAAYVPLEIAFEINRQPDGGRYPNYVQERFALGSDSFLDYSAYFGGMPIEMNHNDGVRWDAGEHGRAVFDAARSILADPALFAELTALSDDVPDPWPEPGFYKLQVERDRGEYSFLLQDRSTRAFGILDAAFAAMLSAFESATGRPLSPGDLPQ
jgi:hypothetical protein